MRWSPPDAMLFSLIAGLILLSLGLFGLECLGTSSGPDFQAEHRVLFAASMASLLAGLLIVWVAIFPLLFR